MRTFFLFFLIVLAFAITLAIVVSIRLTSRRDLERSERNSDTTKRIAREVAQDHAEDRNRAYTDVSLEGFKSWATQRDYRIFVKEYKSAFEKYSKQDDVRQRENKNLEKMFRKNRYARQALKDLRA